MHQLVRPRSRWLVVLALVLSVALTHARPVHAASVMQCNGPTCVTLTATMADGTAITHPVDPADEADEPDADEVVHLVATTNANLAAKGWRLQLVDANGNRYADCGTSQTCQEFVWNDEDGKLFYQPTFVPDPPGMPASPRMNPYGPDHHTAWFAGRVVDAKGTVVVQATYGVVFEEGPEQD